MAEIMQGVVSSIENKMQVKVRPLGIGDSDTVTPPLCLQKITIEIEQGEQTATVTKIYPDVKVGDVVFYALFPDCTGCVFGKAYSGKEVDG